MSLIDLRDSARSYQNGSSAIDIGLTAAQAKAALGDETATGGWYRMAYQGGGDIGRDTDAQKDRDESGAVIGTIQTTDDWTIANTTKQTDARTLKLLAWLDKNTAPVRYLLPTKDATKVQVHYHPAMTKDEGADRISTSAGVRTMQYVLRGDNARHVFDDVAVVETAWPAALTGAKTVTFPGV